MPDITTRKTEKHGAAEKRISDSTTPSLTIDKISPYRIPSGIRIYYPSAPKMSNPQPQPRILGLRFFSLTEMVADKTVWSVRFRSARRTIVRHGTKSDAEKADIKNSSEKSVRILSSFF